MSSATSPPRPWSRGRVALLVLGALAVTFVAPAAIRVVPLPRRIDRQATQLAVSLGALAIGMPAIFAILILDARRRRRWIAWGLESAGLRSESYLLRGVQAHGAIGGRPAHVYWVPASRYRSTSLEISVDSHVAARLAASRGAAIAAPFGMAPLPPGDPSLAHLALTAEDPRWAHGVLADAAGREALRALCHSTSGELRWLKIEPGAVHLRTSGLAPESITPEVVGATVASLVTLADAAERAPPPAHPVQASRLELALRSRSGIGPVIAIVVVLLLVVLAGAGAVMALVFDR